MVHRSTAMLRRFFILILVGCAAWSAASPGALGQDTATKEVPVQGSREAGLAAWERVYSVLTHPRCINCHTATNYPQQGDDRHRHLFNVVRGPEDKGVPAQTPFPNARAYQVLSQYILAGEHTISVDSTDSSIRAYAATNKGGYVLLLINIDSTSTHTLPVTINNAAGASYTATTLTYGKQQYDQSAQGVWAGAVSGNLGTVGTTFNVSLPPWSMTLVTLQ